MSPTPAVFAVWLLALTVACAGEGNEGAVPDTGSGTEAHMDTVRVAFGTVEEIEAFLEEVNYSPTQWAQGVREIPRVYVTGLGDRWLERTQNELSVLAKKRIFFRAMAPLALRSNELIQAEREALLALPPGDQMSAEDRAWVAELAEDYGLEAPGGDMAGAGDTGDPGDPADWDALVAELTVRVDEVPVSLVLAQAANESGWGTSRFTREGNALFGQWSFGGSGMLPEEQRTSLGEYRVAAFESPLLSVIAYMRNLNTHRSYAELRELRAGARAEGRQPTGYDLAQGLVSYSERGQEYVDEIRSMIDYNQLREADDTYLAQGPIYLVVAPEDLPPGGTD